MRTVGFLPKLAAGVLIASCYGCTSGSAPLPHAADQAAPVARRGTFESRVLLTGELKAVEAVPIIVPRTPMWRMPIRWMEADGAEVVAGQKVLELDNTQFSGTLEENRLAESGALNDLMQKEAEITISLADNEFGLAQARIGYEKALLESEVPEELRSRREHEEKEIALIKARVGLEKAQENLDSVRKASEAEIRELRIKLAKARDEVRTAEEAIAALILYAPGDGILVVAENRREGRKLQVGDNVHVGSQVMQIPDLSLMKVEAQLSDVDDGNIAIGMPVTCRLDTYPDRDFTGQVVDITPVAKEQGWQSMRRAFRVVIRLDESDPERMRPGMSVQVEVFPQRIEQALIVPRQALDLASVPPRVLLEDGSAAEVRLGPCNAAECVIEEGIEETAELRSHS